MLHCHCRGHGFKPWLVNEDPLGHAAWPKKENPQISDILLNLSFCVWLISLSKILSKSIHSSSIYFHFQYSTVYVFVCFVFLVDPIMFSPYINFQFSSATQSRPTLCDPVNRSTPGLPVHYQLPESTQTHVHWVGDAIQPSHPLSSPSPPALNLSQHQGLFKWVSSLHQVAKVLELQLQHQSFQWTPRTDLL